MTKECLVCQLTMNVRFFTRKKHLRKDGTIAYVGTCKKCRTKVKQRYQKKKAEPRNCCICSNVYFSAIANKRTCSIYCGRQLQLHNGRVHSAKARELAGPKKKVSTMDEKYTTRGKIHYEGYRTL